ncbi:MAG: hypothetical protein A2234_05535 [Elusimicrobia bacterium RIFOXYA2_FULL_58_8]|nr:MAG: hypothetical protein A2285_09460 [Elusimicrobia bacterium RIFOXYA12_FULL_57_11]OGS17270.1 MAG: hypothetical protein A2234_05535 [Elusimicrobia bacterium RIFOXYA2_FULL_58_8]
MSNQGTGTLERLAAVSLERCLLKISGTSGGGWRLAGISVASGTLAEAVNRHEFKAASAAAVYIHVQSGLPFTSVMLFDPDDIPHIAKCFVGDSLAGAGAIAQFGEVMLLELGNIVLNAVINYLQNVLKKSAIPSVPMFLSGDPSHISGGLGVYMDPRQFFRIVSAEINVSGGGCVSRGAVVIILPEELAAALELP